MQWKTSSILLILPRIINLHKGGAVVKIKIRALLLMKKYDNKPRKLLSIIAESPVAWLRFKLSTSQIQVDHYHYAILFAESISF
jgi:hypothetical protein